MFERIRKTDGDPRGSVGYLLGDKYGKLWMKTGSGFSSEVNQFYPDSLRINRQIPPIVFTRYTSHQALNDTIITTIDREIDEKPSIELEHAERTMVFEFVALNYRNPQQNRYAYMLEGMQEQWVQLGNQRSLTFTNLAPGSYTLRIKGSNNDGVWNEDGAALGIIIHPPWWQTARAYSLYLLLFAGVLFGIRRYELKRIQLRNELNIRNIQAEQLLEDDRRKSSFFASISHEFRTPLTLILGPVERWLGRIEQTEMKADFQIVHRNATRLERLVNQLLDLSRLEAGRMNLQTRPENIVELVRLFSTSFESLARQKGIDLQVRLHQKEIIAYVQRDHLEKIVINLLSNAFKFTPEGGRVI